LETGTQIESLLGRPVLALAPMQDVTDLPFWRLMTAYGGADLYYTEYFRVHGDSRLDRAILASIVENPTGRPVVAQMIGNDPVALVRTARELERHPIAAVDLNLGCPAPVVYRKCAGGGLLRELDRVDRILGALREAISGKFTVKTRVGFSDAADYDRLLALLAKHGVDLVTVHGRTVADGYRSAVRYDLIRHAVEQLPCPVLANGNIGTPQRALAVLEETGCSGLMIGRGAIRNPWLFEQIRAALRGEVWRFPVGRDVLAYVEALYGAVSGPDPVEKLHVQKMKKYLNFLGIGVEPTGQFLHEIRRVATQGDFFDVCRRYLDHGEPMRLEPYELVLAERDPLAG
jgi:tRNA-dihydrouridine synthase B